jgi:nitrous oxidase accessory protein
MNSDDGLAEHNRLFDNSVGIYLMYGKHFTIKDNLLQGSRGPSGHGLGIKEVDGVEVEGNIFYDNRIGIYIDNSPLSPDISNHVRANLIAFNDIGLGLLPSADNNVFTQNSLVDNLEQVTVLGGGQLGDNQWAVDGVGNFWSDYAGYDANGDGIGDIPFRSEQLSEHLMSSWPVLQFYRFSVAEAAVDFGARAVPLFRSEPKFIDPNPLVEPVIPANAARPEYNTDQQATRLWAIGLLAFAALAMLWGWRGSRSNPTGTASAARRSHDAIQSSPAREAALGNPEKLT